MRWFLIIAGALLALGALVVSPLVTIWAANGLFHAGWPVDWAHWAMVLWFSIWIGALFHSAAKQSR